MYFCVASAGLGSCYAGSFRGQIRRKSGISVSFLLRLEINNKGTCLEDNCVHLFCSPCAMIQEKRQIDDMREKGML